MADSRKSSTASTTGSINEDPVVRNLIKDTLVEKRDLSGKPVSVKQRREIGKQLAEGTTQRLGGKTRRHKKRKQHRKTSHRRK